MFTEYEIATMIEDTEILHATQELKKDFIRKEAPYLEINDHDFFSLVMLAPTVGMALANGSISLFEELALNKKARKLSKGGYFLKKDPVVYAMKFLMDKYDAWEEKFFEVLKTSMTRSFDKASLEREINGNEKINENAYKREVLSTPYILIRFIASFFLEQDEDIINARSIAKKEFNRLIVIGEKLELNKIPVFDMFCKTFNVR